MRLPAHIMFVVYVLLSIDPILATTTTNITHFDLFKNTGLGPCSPSDLYIPESTNDSMPAPSSTTTGWASIQTFQAKSESDLCSQFSTLPAIIPTTVNPPAYLPSWPSMLIQWLSLLISVLHLPNYGGPDAPISKSFYAHLVFDFVRLLTWWINLFRGAINVREAEWISVVLWTLPAYHTAVFSSIGQEKGKRWAGKVSSILGVYTAIHCGFTLGIVIVRWKYRSTSSGSYSAIPSALTTTYLNISPTCPSLTTLPENLFSDPDVPGWRDLQTFQFGLCFVWFIKTLFTDIQDHFSITRVKIATIIGVSVSLLLPSLYQALAAWLKGYPGAFTESGDCGPLVVIMMYGRLGYWDVKESIAWRMVQSLLAV
ncbi:hypothetical protein L207DRAFT_584716 [Hyaloscypha variabilis F]|uniref:Uncharacterized protein n=1 Tax=Hyaloscypha variabilis (strain UAMH 11265 / GT02V1 / F) TaxID=1149755 RepID=A0A2J6RLE4_HYAVF|nr:hypothetical protein L207DRAFT_584716 [Hyaloscypha variabilis F]